MPRNKSLSLTKLEQSILREYKRVSYGEQTPQYDVQSIYYSDIPKQLPPSLTKDFKRSIILYNYSYLQMITFAVFQSLFAAQSSQKKLVIEKIKAKICSESFMFGSNFIKGLLVKGLRYAAEKGQKMSKPIAQILMKNESMNAFSQFWKEIIEEECGEQCVKHSDIVENDAYQHISNFLGINFRLLMGKQHEYAQQNIISKFKTLDECITIVIFNKKLQESIITRVLEQNQVQEVNQRAYILLLTQGHSKTPLPFSHEQSSQIRAEQLVGRASAVTKKGNELLNKFRQIYRQMRQHLQ